MYDTLYVSFFAFIHLRTMDNEVMHASEDDFNSGMVHDDYDGDRFMIIMIWYNSKHR